MAKKSALLGGRTVKVENRSSFDKSFLNLLTSNVGTITPILKQLVIPSSGRSRIAVHAELPPLAADTFLRTHLKMEAYFCPARLCDGSFESWFSGEPVWDSASQDYARAELARGLIPVLFAGIEDDMYVTSSDLTTDFGAGSLTDYFDVRFNYSGSNIVVPEADEVTIKNGSLVGVFVNLLPYVAYHRIYDTFYRNKSVSRPAFMKRCSDSMSSSDLDQSIYLPFEAHDNKITVILGSEMVLNGTGDPTIEDILDSTDSSVVSTDKLQSGHHLCGLHQRNYGDDYFTSARPTAQSGNPATVSISDGKFSIASLRLQNALQEFAENQGYATPDYIQTNAARYGVRLSDGIAQRPILLRSADYPIFTKSVEMTSQNTNEDGTYGTTSKNPFQSKGIVGASAGKASANAQGFDFDFDVKEPGYIMVMATLVPEANYASGMSHDMRNFIADGDLVDLPCGLLEHVGDEPIFESELSMYDQTRFQKIFGYVQRYLWHKAGNTNQVHGLFRKGLSLAAFAPQRDFGSQYDLKISSNFLQIPKTALDEVFAVESDESGFGVMYDCAIELFVSEPLSESALPALVNPASEHGRSIYLSNGGSKLA